MNKHPLKRAIVMDIDGTLCEELPAGSDYVTARPSEGVLQKLHDYQAAGFYIILCTSRNMNTFSGNIGLINAKTLKDLHVWLDRHSVPFDEIHVGKPWAGQDGFYVDDRAIRPDEFLRLSYSEILRLTGREPR